VELAHAEVSEDTNQGIYFRWLTMHHKSKESKKQSLVDYSEFWSSALQM
jgi:hypothetical protein